MDNQSSPLQSFNRYAITFDVASRHRKTCQDLEVMWGWNQASTCVLTYKIQTGCTVFVHNNSMQDSKGLYMDVTAYLMLTLLQHTTYLYYHFAHTCGAKRQTAKSLQQGPNTKQDPTGRPRYGSTKRSCWSVWWGMVTAYQQLKGTGRQTNVTELRWGGEGLITTEVTCSNCFVYLLLRNTKWKLDHWGWNSLMNLRRVWQNHFSALWVEPIANWLNLQQGRF